MTGIAHLLEDFGPRGTGSAPAAGPSEDAQEAMRAESYEAGYKAGWEDCTTAQTNDRTHLSADFARNLQDLSFTYHEAHSKVLNAVRPLLSGIVETVVPEALRETLAVQIAAQLDTMARSAAAQQVEIAVAHGNLDATERLADQDFGFPLRVVEDDMLNEGQVLMRLGEQELEIDLGSVIDGVRHAVDAFFSDQDRSAAHG